MTDTKLITGVMIYWTTLSILIILYSLSPIDDIDIAGANVTTIGINVSQPEIPTGDTATGLSATRTFFNIVFGMLTFSLFSESIIINILISGFHYVLIFMTIVLIYRGIRGI